MIVDKAVGTGGEVPAVEEATGMAQVSPTWLTLRNEGEEPPPWTRLRGRWSCLRRRCGRVAVGRCHRRGAVAAMDEAAGTADVLPP